MAPMPDVRGAPLARRVAVVCSAAFIAAAAALTALQIAAPFARGWWLVAYLALVGGLSQLLLVGGLDALASRSGARTAGGRARRARLVLWNAGTLAVAAADLAELQVGVLLGGTALAIALTLFGRDLRRVIDAVPGRSDRWSRSYALLLIFLGCSVVTGVILAG